MNACGSAQPRDMFEARVSFSPVLAAAQPRVGPGSGDSVPKRGDLEG